MNNIVRTENLSKIYGQGATTVTALDRVNLNIEQGEFVAVMGPSGCGKSTLLHLIGGLDHPTNGRVLLSDQELGKLKDKALTELRRRRIGFVFQFFNLIPVLTAGENTALPLILDGMKKGEARERSNGWLSRLGMQDRADHRPDELSGGERQRVAIARALVSDPDLILADEPTGNLDSNAADDIAGLLRQVVDDWGRTVLMVTHDPRLAAHADRIVFLKDGRIVDETRLSNNGREEESAVRAKMEVLS